jgi:t-SNARE complex subunit (syntaxin)
MNIKNKMDHSTNNSKKDANSNVVNQKYMNIIEEYRLIHKEKKHIEDQ